jgi:mono/diheme cytochrome c family protein
MNIDQLVKAAAAAMNLPESMVRKSAEARAGAAGRSVEEILGEWAGVDPSAEAPPADEAPAAEPPAPAEQPAVEQPAAEAAPADAEPAPAAAPASEAPFDAADLLARAAASQGLPEAMVKRSAAARAKAEGKTTDEILAEWAGVELPAGGEAAAPEQPAAAAPPAEPAAEEPAPAAPAAAPAPVAAADTGDLLAKAAAAQGLPEAMVKRSAAARAKAEGKTTDEILAEWAGVEPPAASAAAPAAAPAAATAPAPAAAPAEPAAADIEVIAESEEPEGPPTAEEPERELVTISGALPRWLAALFVAVPLFAVAYAGFLPNGPNCGDAGQLAVDPVTGVAVNCDGSEFGAEEPDYFAMGSQIFGVRCAVCHGPTGAGVASFPPFIDGALVSTFPDGTCAQHQEWVTLGSSGWPDPTYGATNKPVGGLRVLMPGFGTQLTEEEIASVVLFERVQFGGLPLESVQADCGL